MADGKQKNAPFTPGEENATIIFESDGGASAPSAAELRRRLGLPERDDLADYGELRNIGIGGMGAVFSGCEPGLKREIALKMLRPAYRWNPDRISAFIREARTTAQINHPSIIPVYRIGVFDGAGVYFSMKKVRGRTLSTILDRLAAGEDSARRRFTLRRLLEIFIAAGNGVSYAHHCGVVHCDLKPSNLMVGDFGEVLVMDWGMAQYHEDAADPGNKVDLGDEAAADPPESLGGTPAFMAPELLTRKQREPDQQTDVYSLGAILYTILTFRKSPFPAELSAHRLAEIAAQGKLPSFRSAAPPGHEIPRELEAIARKAMAHDRSKRYPSVKKLLDDINHYLDGYPVRAYSPNLLYRFFKHLHRHPAIPTVGFAAALTWFGFTAFSDIQTRNEAENIFALAGYNCREAQMTERKLRRGYRKIVAPRLAESEAGNRLRADLVRQRQTMNEYYTASLELLERLPDNYVRDNSGVAGMYGEIFTEMLGNQLLSRDISRAEETLNTFRRRWSERFDAAVARDPKLRDMVAMIDERRSVLELETDSDACSVLIESADDLEFEAIQLSLSPGEKQTLTLKAGNYLLGFFGDDYDRIAMPVRLTVGLTTSFRHDPPKRPVENYVAVSADEEMDRRGNTYIGGAFLIAEGEVTIGEYLRFWRTLDDRRKQLFAPRVGSTGRVFDDRGRILPPYSADLPVTGIPGRAAIAYCRYLSQKLGRKVRLPFEWEWRRAARGFADYRYPWGEHYLRGHALLADAEQVEKYPHGAPMGSFPGDVSPSGVRNMAGNVREFTLPSNGERQMLMVMGGSYLIPPEYADIGAGQFRPIGERGDDIGFRCLIEE